MSNVRDDDLIKNAEILAEQFLHSVVDFENHNLIDDDAADECVYHLNKIADILGLQVDLDFFNDEYLSENQD